MTDLQLLNVSLTKHGAHKVAALLEQFDKDQVLDNLSDRVPGINIELAQAKKTLAVDEKGVVPALWNTARERGTETIRALVFVAIILSHHRLIAAMRDSKDARDFCGRIVRGKHLDGKAFTNFAHIIEQLGFSTSHTEDYVDYDLHLLFQIPGLNELVAELLTIKLRSVGWSGTNSLLTEVTTLRLQEVFGVKADTFVEWIRRGGLVGDTVDGSHKDIDFFFRGTDDPKVGDFNFKPGHNAKKTGDVGRSRRAGMTIAELRHNEMQNYLVMKLARQFGEECVGSEQATGWGTWIDVVVRNKDNYWFYEIKTDRSVRTCIRQAIPQLLEYAYWAVDRLQPVERLVVVGPSRITKNAANYLALLRTRFGLQLYYETLEQGAPNRKREKRAA